MGQSDFNQAQDGFPKSLPAGDGKLLEQSPGHFAVFGTAPRELGTPLIYWPDEEISVFAGSPTECKVAGQSIVPVYGSGANPAVPTGRIFVRGEVGTCLSDRREELARAGFDLEQTLSYAPHAGWVRAASGKVADSLAHWRRLTTLPTIEHVEIQWLWPRQSRGET